MQVPEIKIVAIGSVKQDVLDYLALTVAGTFNTQAGSLGMTIDYANAYDPARRQYDANKLLIKLLESDLAGQGKVLGVTAVDLFIPILTFVFGLAQVGGRAALISVHRLHPQFYGLPADNQLFYSRCETEANHELGHTQGLSHCQSHSCVMHVSNSIEQVDLKRSSFCTTCSALIGPSYSGLLHARCFAPHR